MLTVFCSNDFDFFKGNFKEGLETLLNISKFHHIEKEFMEKINSDEYKTIIDELIDDIKNKKKKNKKNTDDSEELLFKNFIFGFNKISFNKI